MKAKTATAATPGAIRGMRMRSKTVSGGAPRLAAARSNSVSSPRSAALTTITTKGTASAVCATISPSEQLTRPSGDRKGVVWGKEDAVSGDLEGRGFIKQK